jgi:hypothetical protein
MRLALSSTRVKNMPRGPKGERRPRDVLEWLRKNAPAPRGNLNYHRWLSAQFGLKKLIEHIWMLIGMASVCHDMAELRQRMAEKFGRERIQLTLYLPPPPPGESVLSQFE